MDFTFYMHTCTHMYAHVYKCIKHIQCVHNTFHCVHRYYTLILGMSNKELHHDRKTSQIPGSLAKVSIHMKINLSFFMGIMLEYKNDQRYRFDK